MARFFTGVSRRKSVSNCCYFENTRFGKPNLVVDYNAAQVKLREHTRDNCEIPHHMVLLGSDLVNITILEHKVEALLQNPKPEIQRHKRH